MHPLAVMGSFHLFMAHATFAMGHDDIALFCIIPAMPLVVNQLSHPRNPLTGRYVPGLLHHVPNVPLL
eukprot:12110403-Ditylum_brightwellii.AAC.1